MLAEFQVRRSEMSPGVKSMRASRALYHAVERKQSGAIERKEGDGGGCSDGDGSAESM